jgi:hypothetical protein
LLIVAISLLAAAQDLEAIAVINQATDKDHFTINLSTVQIVLMHH